MELPKNFEFKPMQILKVGGVIIGGLFLLALIATFSKSLFSPSFRMGGQAMMDADFYGAPGSYSKSAENFASPSSPALSARNVIGDGAQLDEAVDIGNSAEDFETVAYQAGIETRNLKKTCAAVAGLKALDYVIFENGNESDDNCYYAFKAEKSHREEILSAIKKLHPKDLSENIATIKKQVDDFTGEQEILAKKMATIDETLKNAIASYDEISRVATQAKDAESLAKIIDSKINIIERLSQQKIQVSEQLDRLSRAKAEQLDRLDYAYFSVNIYENKFVDWQSVKDSWKAAVKEFVRESNLALQDVSVNLGIFILMILKYALYLLIIIMVAKYGWKWIKAIWVK